MTTDQLSLNDTVAALTSIRQWCVYRIKDGATADDTLSYIVKQLDRALKTTPASKLVEQDTLRLDWVLANCIVHCDLNRGIGREALVTNLYTRAHIDQHRIL